MNSNIQDNTLTRRPEARGFRVEQLLQEASDGKLRVPAFQRPLRWKSKSVIDFFDSVRRGFPVGELLLSRDHAKAATVSFGPVAIESKEQPSALWVVDGQQRVTALVATLLRKEETPRGDFWSIWFDLHSQEFMFLQKREAPPTWIPLNVLSDSVRQLKWIRNWSFSETRDDLVDRALELGKSIREYEIPAYIVEGASESVLRMIFTRVNTGGVDMRESEIFEALYGDEGDKPIRSAVARLCDLGFGQLDEDLFLRCLRVTCGLSRRETIDASTDLPPDSISRTETAFRRAINCITLSAGIPHWKLLPYRLPLIALTAFYDTFPNDDPRIDRLAAKWIWRGALTGDHEDVTDARVNRLVKQMRESKNPYDAVISLLSHFNNNDLLALQKNDPLREIDEKISLNRASGKIFVLGMLANCPNRQTGPIQSSLFDDVEDETTGEESATLDTKRFYRSLTDEGNLGSDCVIRISGMEKREFMSSDEQTLSSFLLNRECIEHLSNDEIEDFRNTRRSILERYLQRFVADRLGDRVDVRPSITSIKAVQ
ncbi:DUF262 domain-containing protein [Neorhodopirellula lusitana]|uniref:DUF262 domain-containing protein n=1 Tax=Neorhodopirellula lusitana TaxID=445327 RepID=UPI0038512459